MKHLEIAEEQPEKDATAELNQFEKILVLSKRAKDIYEGRNCLVDGMQGRKPTAMAQAELLEGVIVPLIKDVDPEELKAEFDDEEEEEG